MDRADLLTAALEAVNARPKAYGPPERNFTRISRHWNVYLTGKYGAGSAPLLDAVDVAAMMALMKIARLEETPDHVDSWVDLAGYAACGAECATVIEHDPDEVVYGADDLEDRIDAMIAKMERAREREQDAEPAPRFKVGDPVTVADMTGKFWIHRGSSVGTYSIADQYGSIFHDYPEGELTPA